MVITASILYSVELFIVEPSVTVYFSPPNFLTGWIEFSILPDSVFAQAPPPSTHADLRVLVEPHLSVKREIHVPIQKMASNK